MAPKAIGYLRVSTGRQADSGSSPEAQKSSVENYYRFKLEPLGVKWAGVYEDTVSGGRPFLNRPNGFRVNLALQAGDHLVVHKLDRAFRNTVDCLETLKLWEQHGVTVHFLDLSVDTKSSMGRMFLTIVASFAEWERGRIGDRINEAFAARRKAGRPHSRWAPYGKKIVGKPTQRRFMNDPYQRRVGKMIVEMHDRDGMDFTAIYYALIKQRLGWGGCTGANFKCFPVRRVKWMYEGEKLLMQKGQSNGTA